jgi:hypothetical protein
VVVAEELGGFEGGRFALGGGDDDFLFLRSAAALALFFHFGFETGRRQ